MKKLYKNVDVFYWANALGEISLPEDSHSDTVHTVDELPENIRALYDMCSFGANLPMYPVTVKYNGMDMNGIMVVKLFSSDYILSRYLGDDVHGLTKDQVKDITDDYFRFLLDVCALYEHEFYKQMPGCEGELFVGKDTDPDGHEVCAFSNAVNIRRPSGQMLRLIKDMHCLNIVRDKNYVFICRHERKDSNELTGKVCSVRGRVGGNSDMYIAVFEVPGAKDPIIRAVWPDELLEVVR